MKLRPLEIRQQMMASLADGQFHSGEDFSTRFNISRTSVSAHINKLMEWGLDIFKVKGKGYRLSEPLDILDMSNIQAELGENPLGNIELVPIVDSTNTQLKQNCHTLNSGDILLAEVQTAGRGRHGKQWIAPVGSCLTFSMYWRFSDGYQSMAGLSLLVGLAICEALETFGVTDVGLKWPNDIYLAGEKLAGILIEVEGQIGAAAHAIIGIGLNVKLPPNLPSIDQPFTDLLGRVDTDLNRNKIVARLIQHLWKRLSEFEVHGFSRFTDQWNALDCFYNQNVELHMGKQIIEGKALGVDESGALLLENDKGINRYHGGEVSLRGAK